MHWWYCTTSTNTCLPIFLKSSINPRSVNNSHPLSAAPWQTLLYFLLLWIWLFCMYKISTIIQHSFFCIWHEAHWRLFISRPRHFVTPLCGCDTVIQNEGRKYGDECVYRETSEWGYRNYGNGRRPIVFQKWNQDTTKQTPCFHRHSWR